MKDKHKQMFLRVAHAVAQTSSAQRLKVGSVAIKNNIVIGTGYNALCGAIDGPCEIDGITRPEVRHAEKNMILNLAKCGESSIGATVVCTHSCCVPCALDMIDAGITKFIYETDYRDTTGLDLLRKAGIVVEQITLEDEE